MSPELSHSELAHALRSLALAVTASDLHGSLTGYLCAGADAGPDDWLDALELGFEAAGEALTSAADVAAGGGGATIFTALCRSLARIGQGPSVHVAM